MNAPSGAVRLPILALLLLLASCAHKFGMPDAEQGPTAAPPDRAAIGQMLLDGHRKFVVCGAACPPRTPKYREEVPAAPAPHAEAEATTPPSPMPAAATGTLPELHLYFAFDSSLLSPQAVQQLQAHAAELARASALQLHACADSVGGPRANVRVARQRAQAVRRWLASALPQLAVEVVTDRRPGDCYVASNRSEDGRRLNRRVDLAVAAPRLAPRHGAAASATTQARRK